MSFDERTQGFLSWLSQKSVDISPKIQIEDLRKSGQGRCLIAKGDISVGEELFSIPRSSLLNVETSTLVKDHAEAETLLVNMTQWEALILVLMYEWKVKGDSSPWKSYLDVLPLNDESYESDQLIFWSDAELSQLAPSYIVNRVGHDSAQSLMKRLEPHFKKFVGEVTDAEFQKVASVIMSYSFDVGREDDEEDESDFSDEEDISEYSSAKRMRPDSRISSQGEAENDKEENKKDDGDSNEETVNTDKEELVKNSQQLKSMVPLADTLNADTRKHNASLFMTADRLVMRCIQPIMKNDQIFNIYAEHPNSEILRRYGYVEQEGSAFDFAEVSLETFKKYFAENSSLSKDTIEEVVSILEEIEAEEDESFVLDFYDCFATGEVIFELTFLTQLFVIIAAINHKKSFNSASLEVKARAIRRVYKKTYQLLESRKLTAQFMKDFPNILKVRLSEYPRKAIRGLLSPKETPLSRSEMAMVVLSSECISLQNCMDTEKVFTTGDQKFSIIDDEKLLRNIMKKDTFEGSDTQPAKKTKTS